MKTTIYLPMAAMLLTAALAVSAAAQKQVLFNGSLKGQEISTPQGGPPPTTLLVNGQATGAGTLVGRFSFTYQLTVTLATATATGSAHLVAANGDSIYTTIVGALSQTSTPGVVRITEINTITGGTGRFAEAQGSFIVERLETQATGVFSGSFGTITLAH